jgi:tRNA U34 5-carboxymethylaminomethyl modifying enzyme MnmG/GidA
VEALLFVRQINRISNHEDAGGQEITVEINAGMKFEAKNDYYYNAIMSIIMS